MQQRCVCAAVLALFLVAFLVASWISCPSGVAHFPPSEVSGDYLRVVRTAFSKIEHRTTLPFAMLVRIFEQSQTRLSDHHEARNNDVGRVGHGSPLSPNISACHPSLSDKNKHVNCCPPSQGGDETVVDFRPPAHTISFPVRIRRPAHLVDDEYIAKYQRAVAIMKSLPSDHPHNFHRQANIHCIYCTGSYNQANSLQLFKIHRSWLFFPWHRALLYFHERILGKLIGDDEFALPFWNWDAPEGMAMPKLYTMGVLNHTNRDVSHLPPQVPDLNYKCCIPSQASAEEQMATNLAFMYNQMVSGAKKPELFLGCKLRSGDAGVCNAPGTVESAPHNTLHTWVGSDRNPEREDMGAFYSAARDPIFYAHHANIDRLWHVWRELQGLGDRPDFDDTDWLDSSFTFYDENLQLVRIKVRDCLDPVKLGYTYEEIASPWLDARPKPAVPPEVARDILTKRNYDRARMTRKNGDSLCEAFVTFEPTGRVLDRTITVSVRRPEKGLRRMLGEEQPTNGSEEEEVLVVHGIQVKGDKYAKFDVFVNLVADGETAGPRSREFAGTFVNVPRGLRRAVTPEGNIGDRVAKATLKLGISELLQDLGVRKDDECVWVSLVPRVAQVVTVDGIRVDYIT